MTPAQADVLQRWEHACIGQHGDATRSREFVAGNAEHYRWSKPKEPCIGAAIGIVERHYGSGVWKRSGSYRIDTDGAIARAPKWLHDAAMGQKVAE